MSCSKFFHDPRSGYLNALARWSTSQSIFSEVNTAFLRRISSATGDPIPDGNQYNFNTKIRFSMCSPMTLLICMHVFVNRQSLEVAMQKH